MTNALEYQISEIYSKIDEMQHELVFTSLANKISDMFAFILLSLQNLDSYLNNLMSQVTEAINSKLSVALITPQLLRGILEEVEGQLDPQVCLPLDFKKNIKQYFELLDITIIPDLAKFHLIIPLSIVDKSAIFDIYKIINTPVSNPKSPEGQFYKYAIESQYFALSLDRDSYMLLDDTDLDTCHGLMYCKLKSAIYSLTASKSCLSSLYVRDSQSIIELCGVIATNPGKMPVVKHLSGSSWIISTSFNFDLEITCNSKRDIKQITKGIRQINLPEKCMARSQYFTLPYTVNLKSEHKLLQEFSLPSNTLDFNLTIYKSAKPFVRSKLQALQPLANLKPKDIGKLQSLITDQSYLTNKKLRIGFDTGFVFIFIISLLVFGILLYKYKPYKRLYACKKKQDVTVPNVETGIQLKECQSHMLQDY